MDRVAKADVNACNNSDDGCVPNLFGGSTAIGEFYHAKVDYITFAQDAELSLST